MEINKCRKCGEVPMYSSNCYFWCECSPLERFKGSELWNESNPTKKKLRKLYRALEAELMHTDKCMAERLAKITDLL